MSATTISFFYSIALSSFPSHINPNTLPHSFPARPHPAHPSSHRFPANTNQTSHNIPSCSTIPLPRLATKQEDANIDNNYIGHLPTRPNLLPLIQYITMYPDVMRVCYFRACIAWSDWDRWGGKSGPKWSNFFVSPHQNHRYLNS